MNKEKEIYLFHQGTYYHCYNLLGCHTVKKSDLNVIKNSNNDENVVNNNKNLHNDDIFIKNDENVESCNNSEKIVESCNSSYVKEEKSNKVYEDVENLTKNCDIVGDSVENRRDESKKVECRVETCSNSDKDIRECNHYYENVNHCNQTEEDVETCRESEDLEINSKNLTKNCETCTINEEKIESDSESSKLVEEEDYIYETDYDIETYCSEPIEEFTYLKNLKDGDVLYESLKNDSEYYETVERISTFRFADDHYKKYDDVENDKNKENSVEKCNNNDAISNLTYEELDLDPSFYENFKKVCTFNEKFEKPEKKSNELEECNNGFKNLDNSSYNYEKIEKITNNDKNLEYCSQNLQNDEILMKKYESVECCKKTENMVKSSNNSYVTDKGSIKSCENVERCKKSNNIDIEKVEDCTQSDKLDKSCSSCYLNGEDSSCNYEEVKESIKEYESVNKCNICYADGESSNENYKKVEIDNKDYEKDKKCSNCYANGESSNENYENVENSINFDDEDSMGAWFRCWAPNAKKISVVGDFNGWDYRANEMKKIEGSGIWETYVQRVNQYDNYKYQILTADNRVLMKADPYAFHSETNGATASKVYRFSNFEWTDKQFFEGKASNNHYELPMNVYEVNLCSWKKKPNGDYYSYRELGDELSAYARDMGYTHIELMPLAEYPFDGSWGYQPTGYFSVTSRFGTPEDFKYFVNKCHENGIGVILDWVPAHFPKDEHGLIEWDGSFLYENQGWDKIEHKSWGTRRFDYGREEVQSFLISSVTFFIETYHIDGIRVDAVASMLYLDYDKKPNEWLPNKLGDNKNLEAIAFLQKLNSVVLTKYPSVIMIAEESTAFPLVTKPAYVGGLGFNYKWNIGWMNDTLSYVSIDPFFRKDNHEKLTFSMFYAFSENFILPISHDEVVHGKKSLLNKMYGDYDERFEMLKTFMMYMFAHPGKKLSFMGNEFAQFDEWNNYKGIDFMLLGFEKHNNIFKFTKELNHIYLKFSELYEIDYSWNGFRWLVSDDKRNNVIAFERKNKNEEIIICVANFSPVEFKHYRIGVEEGRYVAILSSNDSRFGGSGKITKFVTSEKIEMNNFSSSIDIALEPYSAVYFKKQELKLSVVSKFYNQEDESDEINETKYKCYENKISNNLVCNNFKNDKNVINKILKYKIKEKINKISHNLNENGDNNEIINQYCNNLDKINKKLQDKNLSYCDKLSDIDLSERLKLYGDDNDLSFYSKLLSIGVENSAENFEDKKRKRGRPRRVLSSEEINKPKRGRGRPRKIFS